MGNAIWSHKHTIITNLSQLFESSGLSAPVPQINSSFLETSVPWLNVSPDPVDWASGNPATHILTPVSYVTLYVLEYTSLTQAEYKIPMKLYV